MQPTRWLDAFLFAALVAVTPVLASPKVIESVGEARIRFTDGTAVAVVPGATVERPGYELSFGDLRPGWAVETAPASGPARRITVAGIPLVRRYPEIPGPRASVAVGRCEMGLMPSATALQGVDVQQAVESLVASALEATGRFTVVDAASRDELMNEHDFAHSGYADVQTAARSGRLMSPEYLVKLLISDLDVSSREGSGFTLLGTTVATSRTRARLGLEIRLVSVETGRLEAVGRTSRIFGSTSRQVRWNVSETVAALAVDAAPNQVRSYERIAAMGISVARNGFHQSPLGELLSLAVDDAVTALLEEVRSRPLETVVVDVRDEMVILRGGDDSGLRIGQRLDVVARGAALTDPLTGESLGSLETTAGAVEVVEIREQVSIARILRGASIKRGDLCRTGGMP